MTAADFFDSVRNLAFGSTSTSCVNCQLQQVAFTGFHGMGDSVQTTANFIVVTVSTQFFQTFDLRQTNCSVVDFQNIKRIFFFQTVIVYADNFFGAGIDMSLTTCCRFFDTHFRKTGINSFRHTAELFDFLDMCPGFLDQLIGQCLYIIGTAPRINNFADFGFVLNVQLSITSNTSREICRQRDSFVQSVSMQRLGMPQSCCHSLDTGTRNIVERILLCQAPAGSLRMCTQSHRFGFFRAEGINDFRPQHTSCTHFSNFHKVVFTHCPEEGQTRCKLVNSKTMLSTCTQIFETVG